jgi:type IX secretion system PorP/SprF family membrane protein
MIVEFNNTTAMKTKIYIVLIAVISISLLSGKKANAQFDQMFTQYMHNEMFINPAYAGANGVMALTLLHRQQWVGFPGRPITTTFSINAPLMQGKMGVGLSYLNEKIGALNRNLVYATYAYRIRLNTKSYLSFGLMGGAHLQFEKFNDLYNPNPDDPYFVSNIPLTVTPNFGFGMYYNTEKFYASFSIPRLLDDNLVGINGKNVRFSFKSLHYYLAVGRMFTVNDFFKIKPNMMIKAAVNTPMEFDLNLDALLFEKFWLGLSYRSNADISFKAGVQIFPNWLVSYSYDYQVTRIHKYSGGSHEIMMSYLLDYTGKKIISPRYF